MNNPKGNETEFAFGLQIDWNTIPIKAPQKHPVTVDYKEFKRVEKFNRALCFTGDREKTRNDMLCFLC